MLSATRTEVVAAFLFLFDSGESSRADADAMPDLLNEDFAAEGFSAKLGRWSREALNEISKDLFWGMMFIANTCRRPVGNLQNWLQKVGAASCESEVPPVVHFICKK